jgi:hypothetical protein
VATLKYVGPYPCLELKFPDLPNHHHHPTNKKKNDDGGDDDDDSDVVLTFVLDTGANVNSIDAKLVRDWNLDLALPSSTRRNNSATSFSGAPLIGLAGASAPSSSSSSSNTHPTTTNNNNNNNNNNNSMMGGYFYSLGTRCQLVGLPPEQQEFIFLRNLSAVSLTKASPVGHGILGQMFFRSFPAGVEFDWSGTDGDPPTLIFHFGRSSRPSSRRQQQQQQKQQQQQQQQQQQGPRRRRSIMDNDDDIDDGMDDIIVLDNGDGDDDPITRGMTRVPLRRLPGHVFAITLKINNGSGVEIPALLDTGAPMTIFNPEAATLAGIDTCPPPPLRTILENDTTDPIQQQQQQQQQQMGDEHLKVTGSDGGMLRLRRSVSPISIQTAMGDVSLGSGHVYVGDLPGLAMIMTPAAAVAAANDSIITTATTDSDASDVSDDNDAPPRPAAILGLDFLRRTHRMTLRVGGGDGEEDEVWFEEWKLRP